MTTVFTWRLTNREWEANVRFILLGNTLFRLLTDKDDHTTPLGYSYVSVKDAHMDAAMETQELELRGYVMELGSMRWTEVPASPSEEELLMWVWDDPEKARAELVVIGLMAIMHGEVLA